MSLDDHGHLTNKTDRTEKRNAFFILFFKTCEGLKGSQCPELEDQNDELPVDPKVVQELLLKLDFCKLRVLIGLMQECTQRAGWCHFEASLWFLKILGNLKRFQLTGSWLMLPQFSRTASRMALETTGLPLQWLVKLWRWLFWELLKNTWTITQSSEHFQAVKILLVELYFLSKHSNPPSWSRETIWCNPSGFQLSFCCSHSVLLDKMSIKQLHKHIMCWVRNWLTSWAEGVTVNEVTSNWWPVTSGVPHLQDLHKWLTCRTWRNTKFTDDSKIWRVVNSPEGKEALQRDQDKLNDCAIINHMKLKKGNFHNFHILHPAQRTVRAPLEVCTDSLNGLWRAMPQRATRVPGH